MEIWGGAELLSVSLNAERTLTKSIFKDIEKAIYLNIKKDKSKIKIDDVGTGALSIDGKYIVVAKKDTINLFHIDSFLEKNKLEIIAEKVNFKRLKFDEVTPLWKHKVENSKLAFISNDNKYILVLTGKDEKRKEGGYQKLITRAYLFDISGKLIWDKEVRADQYKIKTTSNLKCLIYQEGEKKIKMFVNY